MKELEYEWFAKMFCRVFIGILLLLFLIVAPGRTEGSWKLDVNSDIARILALAPENSWVKLNANRYDDAWTPFEQRPKPPEAPNVGSPHSIILAWSSMAWDSNRGNIIIWGGGHANYPGNETYIWETSSLNWTRGSLPSDVKLISGVQYEAIDGVFNAPIAAHTYDNSEFFPILDRFVTFGGAAFNTGTRFVHADGSPTGPYFFDPALADANAVGGTTGSQVSPEIFTNVVGKNMWTNRDNLIPSTPGEVLPNYFINTASAYAEENGVDALYLQTNSQLFRYSAFSTTDSSQDTYEVVGTVQSGSTFSGQGAGAYDPQRKIFVRTAGSSFIFWDLNQPNGVIARNVIFSPVDSEGTFDFSKLIYFGLDYDHLRQVFLLWDGNQDIWQLIPPADLASGTWTLSRFTPDGLAAPQNTIVNPVLGKWKYARALDAYIGLYDANAGDIWVYKPANWQPEIANDGVAIANLVEGEVIYSNQSIEISVYALGKTISSVQYLLDGNVIGSSDIAPFGFQWDNRIPGSYVLTANALFTDGTSAGSSPINVVVSSDTIQTLKLQNGLDAYTGTIDTYLDEGLNAFNFSGKDTLYSRPTGARLTPLVRFAIFESEGGPIPDGALIRKAKLSLYKYSVYDHVYGLHRILSDWDGSSVSWLQRTSGVNWGSPGANTSGVDFSNLADGEGSIAWDVGWLEVDVTPGVQDMSANGQNYGWKLVPISGNNNLIRFSSSESANAIQRPVLEIEYVSGSGPVNSAPTVSMTAPTAGAAFIEGSPVLMVANASDADGSIAKVEFYADGVLLNEDLTSPYEFSWANATVGAHTLHAVATDNNGKKRTSASVSITVNPVVANNFPPTVNLTSPLQNAEFQIGTSIQFNATASDSDGFVAKVAFYANGNLLGEVFNAPYQFVWTNPAVGSYSLHAIATDDDGSATTSQSNQINVIQSTPSNGTKVVLQEGLNSYAGTADAYAYEHFSTINYGNSDSLLEKPSGSRLAPFIRFAIFDSEGGPVPDGAVITSAKLWLFKYSFYDHVYRAHRVLKNWAEQDVTWEQSESGILWGSAGALGMGQDIAVAPDGEAAVSWNPGWLSLDVTSGVQSMSATGQNHGWRLVPVSGNSNLKKFASSEYQIDATLRPKLEIEYLPDSGSVNLPPTVRMTAPASDSEFVEGTPVLLTADASDPDGVITKVEFYANGVLIGADASSPYEFSWTNALPGTQTLQAVATDDGGKTTVSLSTTIIITDLINQLPVVSLTAPSAGAIFEVGVPILISADANDIDGTVTKVAFYADGALLGEVTQAPYEFSWTNATEGMHTVHAIVTDDGALTGASESVGIDVTQTINNGSVRVTLQRGVNGFANVWDSYIYEYHDFVNFGTSKKLFDKSTGSRLATLVQFAIFESEGGLVPDQAVVTSAKLKLYKSSFYDHVYRAHPVLVPWLENQVTWHESQLAVFWDQVGANGIGVDIDSQFDGEGSAPWGPDWLVVDVTSGVQAIQSGRANFGWKLVPVSGNTNTKTFVSSEYAEGVTLRPALEIEYLLE
ncbi:MAG: DNRLRE domain-containing protein [Burkholderiales bacterium]|nr:DNRLRE domain-containing protein [Burkholderiales bacterium]MDR4518256.1 Ig-like domain-containing protein [Nitrosomonas sp.]